MFEKILIANRGEIALRIQRACREMGIRTVVVYSEADVHAKYVKLADEAVCIGPPEVSRSYLNAAAYISTAEVTDAEAIHPGYGLLSENADFAEQVEKSGFAFIGPKPETMRLLADKLAAKRTMKKFGIPSLPGGDAPLSEDIDESRKEAAEIGYPVLIKAAHGGGGRGMRVVHTEAALPNAIATLRAEAANAFGNDALYMERLLENPRHIEVQILADRHRGVVHLGTRECSVQRRHQKIAEEAPAPHLPKKIVNAVCEKCADACRKIDYVGAGTFEFLYDGEKLHFIEMNARLQVEHPVTEMITGMDIVIEQIRVAAGEPLSVRQKDIIIRGHAIECRINAEHPRTLMPSPGMVVNYHPAGGPGVRVDSHLYSHYAVPPHYDSLIGKLIVHGATRAQAIARMQSALSEFVVEGVETNIPLHRDIFLDAAFIQGGVGIHYLEEKLRRERGE